MKKSAQSGFTLLELLITVGVIATLAAIVIIGVNPARQISNTRNAQRLGNIANIQGAINHYAIDTFTGYPASIDTTLRMLGTAANGCAVSCGPEALTTPLNSFIDNIASAFNAGTFSNTQWNSGVNAVDLTNSGLSAKTGTYTSSIKNAGTPQTWTNFTWTPGAPYGKELPNNGASESAYPSGNATMTNNVLLMHMNETSGSIADASGSNNNGTATNVTYAVGGKIKNGLNFNGASSYIQVPTNSSLNLPNTGGSVMLWMRPNVVLPQDTGMGIIRKPDYNGNL